ncbi:MAG: hypothetical protein ABIG71_03650 [Candidatus Uhrbacteria bacterium]
MITTSSYTSVRRVAATLLPVLVVLYPLFLILDDIEPGFVRSVFNPHWCLIALIVVGTLAGQQEVSHVTLPRWAARVLTLAASVMTALWMWWRLGGGMLGIAVACCVAVAIISTGYIVLTPTNEGADEL